MLPFAPRLRSPPSRTLRPSSHPTLAKSPSLLFSRASEKVSGTVSSRLSSSLPSRFQTRLFQTLWQRRRQASSPLNLEIAIARLREEEAILKAAQNLKVLETFFFGVCICKRAPATYAKLLGRPLGNSQLLTH